MKDRAPLYPGRVMLTPVPGQPNKYDMVRADEPTEAGTPLSKATLLTDATAALLGGNSEMLPTEALGAIVGQINTGWKPLWSRTTAGSGTWTAPDINNGKAYSLGALVIGAGAGGGAYRYEYTANGGCCGLTATKIMTVTPGASYTWVIGSGGAGGSKPSSGNGQATGSGGGASSFATYTALGGSATPGAGLNSQPPIYPTTEFAPFGGVVHPTTNNTSSVQPNLCFNPFTLERILGAGGSVRPGLAGPGGKYPDGSGGGDGVLVSTAAGSGQNANAPGCGGGAVGTSNTNAGTLVGGKGADGGIYLYVRGLSI